MQFSFHGNTQKHSSLAPLHPHPHLHPLDLQIQYHLHLQPETQKDLL